MASVKYTNMDWPDASAAWKYTSLPEPQLSHELARISLAKSLHDTDCVSFQPCPFPSAANQDRYIVQNWPLTTGTWSFRAVLDGHAGHETVDFASGQLPIIIRDRLDAFLVDGPAPDATPRIADILRQSITHLDELVVADLLKMFPDPSALTQLPDDEIRSVINDRGPMLDTVYRCMSGSTVLLSLADPSRRNLWVASLGDSQAGATILLSMPSFANLGTKVLGYKTIEGLWQTKLLSSFHNGEEEVEANRVRADHPGEQECIIDGRVLGAIAVTRAVGDFIFKLPRSYADHVFKNAELGFNQAARPEEFLNRNLTPPYISNIAHVAHVDLASLGSIESHLILCSDGLVDLYQDKGLNLDEMVSEWSGIIVKGIQQDVRQNLALLLLRESIGGQDLDKVSRTVTVELCFRWMDDTTILVQRL